MQNTPSSQNFRFEYQSNEAMLVPEKSRSRQMFLIKKHCDFKSKNTSAAGGKQTMSELAAHDFQ
jgi:hypothetical protein